MRIPERVREWYGRLRSLRIYRPERFDIAVFGALIIAAIVGLALIVWLVKGPTIIVRNGQHEEIAAARGPLSGLPCTDSGRRPIAVMLASDPEARPLSGLRDADMVFEVPVTPNGITRFMAVFQCSDPGEVGSIRSSRETFIPLVQGVDAIYAHWGGEHGVLEKLDSGIVDNVDALKYEGTVYYRKSGIPRPHNGFTTLEAVRRKAEELGYAASASLTPYLHTTDTAGSRNLGSIADDIVIPGPAGLDVEFKYDPGTRAYARWRGGEPEIDRDDGLQVSPSVVVVMQAEVDAVYDQYMDLVTVGQGNAVIYQNGTRIDARWRKTGNDAMLQFIDASGAPVPLVPGQLWVVIQAAP